jgi:hypothetical protein
MQEEGQFDGLKTCYLEVVKVKVLGHYQHPNIINGPDNMQEVGPSCSSRCSARIIHSCAVAV